MNATNWEHAVIALLMQCCIVAICSVLDSVSTVTVILSALPPLFFFFSREHAQTEQSLKKKYGVDKLNWKITLEALCFWRWKMDTKLDFFLPFISVVLITISFLLLDND